MIIILNEREYIEDIIKNRDLGISPFRTICNVARYYYSLGYKPTTIRNELEHFMLRCDPDINIVKWADSIDKAVSKAGKRPLVDIDNIPVTEKEIEACKKAGQAAYQRLAFTMLVLAKYFNLASGHSGGWVNAGMKDIFALANISTAKKRQAFMIGGLIDKGMIKPSYKIDNINNQVLFIDNESDPVLLIEEIRDLGYQYERHLYGEKDYPKCQVCGKIFRREPNVNRTRKYCKDCSKEVIRRRDRERKMPRTK